MWTNSYNKKTPITAGAFDTIIWGLMIAVGSFSSEFFLERGFFPLEAALSKASGSSEEKNSRCHDYNCQGGQQHLIKERSVIWGMKIVFLPSAVSSSADSPSQSWSGKKRCFNLYLVTLLLSPLFIYLCVKNLDGCCRCVSLCVFGYSMPQLPISMQKKLICSSGKNERGNAKFVQNN